MDDPSVLVVLNPVAGSVADVQRLKELMNDRLGAAGLPFRIHETEADEDPAMVVRAACAAGVTRVVAAGGDGTVGAVVNGLIGTAVPMGIVPVGTGNILSRTVGIPLKWEAALDVALSGLGHGAEAPGDRRAGRQTQLDIMRVGGRYYVLNVSVGLSAYSIRDTSRKDKRRFGMLAYALRVAGHLLGFHEYRIDLEVDTQRYFVQATEVLVSNGELLENVITLLGSAASVQDGQVEAYVVHARSLVDYIAIVLRKLTGTARPTSRYQQLSATSTITIAPRHRVLPVQADGEVIGTTPVTIDVIPRAVHVILPAAVTRAAM